MLDALLKEIEMEDKNHYPNDMPIEENDEEKQTILIAEDDDLIRRSITRILRTKGYEVLEAENGAIALEIFREKMPALVLTDLRMPEMDGFELLEKVWAESPQTPVIIISGVGTKPDIIRALRSGAWDYIMKPIEDINYLVDTIDKVLVQADMNRGYHQLMEKALQKKNEELEQELKKRKILENQLLHAKREWEKTVDSITEAIALVDKNSLLIRVNRAMADLIGLHPRGSLARPVISPRTDSTTGSRQYPTTPPCCGANI
ncbi:MAG: hypothetical protein Kow0089_24530 [Desulfobulbaceae bacterium]